jgi:hypothetical protein
MTLSYVLILKMEATYYSATSDDFHRTTPRYTSDRTLHFASCYYIILIFPLRYYLGNNSPGDKCKTPNMTKLCNAGYRPHARQARAYTGINPRTTHYQSRWCSKQPYYTESPLSFWKVGGLNWFGASPAQPLLIPGPEGLITLFFCLTTLGVPEHYCTTPRLRAYYLIKQRDTCIITRFFIGMRTYPCLDPYVHSEVKSICPTNQLCHILFYNLEESSHFKMMT